MKAKAIPHAIAILHDLLTIILNLNYLVILFSILYQILFLLVSETHENDGQGAGNEQ